MLPVGHVLAGTISGTVEVNGLRSPANILVYLNRAPEQAADLAGVDSSGARFVMDQRNLTFLPHVLPVPVGATVRFPNNDKVAHNVFSLSRTKQFNLGSYGPGEVPGVVFDRPGVVELRCDVHAEMLAYIVVMKNPYFAVTDDQGRFTIPDTRYLESHGITGIPELPAGRYNLKSRHPKLKTGNQSVTVPAGGTATAALKLSRGTPGALYK
jgi:plastocyanin